MDRLKWFKDLAISEYVYIKFELKICSRSCISDALWHELSEQHTLLILLGEVNSTFGTLFLSPSFTYVEFMFLFYTRWYIEIAKLMSYPKISTRLANVDVSTYPQNETAILAKRDRLASFANWLHKWSPYFQRSSRFLLLKFKFSPSRAE